VETGIDRTPLIEGFPMSAAKRFTKGLLSLGIASVCLLALCGAIAPAAAAEDLLATVTAEERAACTPDVFRLCSSALPSVKGVIACMKRERPKLSPACAAAFDARIAKSKTAAR
jgi:hypothetical protein